LRSIQRFYSSIDYLRRHYRTGLRHLTFRKLANLCLNEWERKQGRTHLKSRPYFIKIEPTPLCQITCTGCWHGRKKGMLFPAHSRLTYENFVKIIEPIRDTLIAVSLSFRGDSLLNRDVYRMIDYCKRHNIGTDIPTNLSYVFKRNELEQLIDAGLDHLIVAVDGTDQQTYEKYRKGGKLKLVLKNCETLIELKKKKRTSNPLVECKFILFEHNKHQFDDVKSLSRSMGFDRFSSVLDFGSSQRKNEVRSLRTQSQMPVCYWPYRTSIITWDGFALPCCDGKINVIDLEDNCLGNVITDGFMDVWNGEKYTMLRQQVVEGTILSSELRFCAGCFHFRGSRSYTHKTRHA